MQWVKLTLHFPSFFSYRIPDYSSQYALSVPLPSPSAVKLGIVATAIRYSGNVSEGKRVFSSIRDGEVRIIPPEQIAVNSVFIKRLKKKKNDPGFEQTFGVREYVFFPTDVKLFISCDNIDVTTKYFNMLRYLGSGDSIVYVKCIEQTENPPELAIRPITDKEFAKALSNRTISKESSLIYPVKDISKKANFDQINPYSGKSGRYLFERKYYLIRAKIEKGKNWKIIKFQL